MSGLWPGRRAKRREARAAALTTRSAVRRGYVGVDERWGALLHDAVVAAGALAAGDGFALQIEEHRQLTADAIQTMTATYLRAESAPDPETSDDVEELLAIRQTWNAVGHALDEAVGRVDALEGLVGHIGDVAGSAAVTLTTLTNRLETATTAVRAASSEGFEVARLDEALAGVGHDLDSADTALGAQRLWDADVALRRADQVLMTVDRAARDLPATHRGLLVRHGQLAEQLRDHQALVDRVGTTVTELRSRFAASVWDPLSDAPAQTAEALEAAADALTVAAEASTMRAQRFDDAERALTSAESQLRAIAQIDAAVAAVRDDVEAAIAEYPAAHLEARRSLDQAVAFARAHVHDVNPAHLPNLGRAAEILADAERVAATGRGDPILAVTRLREVDRYTDAVLYRARTDKQQRDAHRQAAVHRLRDAQRAVHRATSASGHGLFGWSARAKADLDVARRSLGEAGAVLGNDPGRAMALAAQAEQIAVTVIHQGRTRRTF